MNKNKVKNEFFFKKMIILKNIKYNLYENNVGVEFEL